jgi:hypothetical protein
MNAVSGDSSGFSTSQFRRWFVAKYGGECDFRKWIKLHCMVGVRTNVVTSIEVSTSFANDSPYFKGLVDDTVNSGFQVAEVSADKAYLSHKNLDAVLKHGAKPYIPCKSNTAQASRLRSGIRCCTFTGSIMRSLRPTITGGQTWKLLST